MTSSSVGLAWNDVTGETGFRVERAPGGTSQWAAVGVAARDNFVFTDTGLAASTSYKYRVIATSRNGDSAPSAVLTVTTLAPPPPAAPGGVSAAAVSSSRIDVGWQDVTGESGYAVQRSADGATGWAQVGSVGQDVTSVLRHRAGRLDHLLLPGRGQQRQRQLGAVGGGQRDHARTAAGRPRDADRSDGARRCRRLRSTWRGETCPGSRATWCSAP